MPIAGLVLTLGADASAHPQLIAALSATAAVTVGTAHGPRLPLVLETETVQAIDEACRTFGSLSGVELVELAFLDFSDLDEGEHDGQT